jgi:hypothetical protein
MERPAGVTAVAILISSAAAYLVVLGAGMLLDPGSISMLWGSPVLGGLELAGPYMFLLMGLAGVTIAAGLFRLHRWARLATISAALLGVIALVPEVSTAAIDFRAGKLLSGGLGIMLRVMILWYLFQSPVADAFKQRPPAV